MAKRSKLPKISSPPATDPPSTLADWLDQDPGEAVECAAGTEPEPEPEAAPHLEEVDESARDEPASGEETPGPAGQREEEWHLDDNPKPQHDEIPLAEPALPRIVLPGPSPSRSSAMDSSKVLPRGARGDLFEQNPLSAKRTSQPVTGTHQAMDDSSRVREALRSVIAQGGSVQEAAKEWNVAPSSIQEWRSRYQELLDENQDVPLLDPDGTPRDATVHIPEAAQELFSVNWARLVAKGGQGSRTFSQSPLQIYLQTSRFTSWLYQDGYLDRSILVGVISCVVGLAIVGSFLMARKVEPAPVVLEAAPRDDLELIEAQKVAEAFFKAPNWEARLPMVRQPEAVREMMAEYYKTHSDQPVEDAELILVDLVRKMPTLSYEIPSLGKNHFLILVKIKGHYVVDWESSSLYQEDHLHKLREERSTGNTRIAVTVTADESRDYYNFEYRDAAHWKCYQLSYPGLKLNLFGYAPRNSTVAVTLDALLGVVSQQGVVLEVKFAPGAKSDNQVEIVSVLREEWVPVSP